MRVDAALSKGSGYQMASNAALERKRWSLTMENSSAIVSSNTNS
jgi:hypothetical protein